VGFSRLCWPNLSYYVGSRYLRRIEHPLGERELHGPDVAATYVLNARYTAVFAEQFDFEQGTNIRHGPDVDPQVSPDEPGPDVQCGRVAG
jgi:hypothetical protein